jgi:hypothetical protein
MQYVGVRLGNKVYSYQWDGERPMQVGDRCVIPPNYLNEYPGFGEVVHIYGSREEITYKGQLANLMGVVDAE